MKSDFINCKNCTDDCHCKGKDITPICISFKPAKTTNADRIRGMSVEELAELFMQEYDGADSFTCPVPHPCPPEKEASCRECFIGWLKEEANE